MFFSCYEYKLDSKEFLKFSDAEIQKESFILPKMKSLEIM